jgi:hypothetical protein
MSTDLPELPAPIKRRLELKWAASIESHGLTGNHLKSHQAELHRLASVAVRYGWDKEEYLLQLHPSTADHVGILRTVELAKDRFEQKSNEYLAVWMALSGTTSEQFEAWLTGVRAAVLIEVADIWKSEWHSAWFDRACRKGVDDALTDLQRGAVSRARQIEIARLEDVITPTGIADAKTRISMESSNDVANSLQSSAQAQPESLLDSPHESTTTRKTRRATEYKADAIDKAERAVNEKPDVPTKIAAIYLRCGTQNILKLIRKGNKYGKLSAIKLKPMRITSASLKEYRESRRKN